jgi:hypothetical protein
MKVEIELSREQVEDTISGVLGASYNHWFWWQVEDYDNGYDWNKLPADLEEKFLTVSILDPDKYFDNELEEDCETITKKLSVADILRAWSSCSVQGYRLTDEDACSSDAVMQTAVLGTVEYC